MTETFHATRDQAHAYGDLFVPALFGQWAPQLVDCARVRHGQSVLDVACGTGVVARSARDVVGPSGRVVGVDLNPAMLEVARRM
jgi:ubiquinone/menaquinone biosynthesis C-methylase UbiE